MQRPATDVPMFVTTGYFRLAADRYYVPVSVAVPGSALPPPAKAGDKAPEKVTLDVAGFIRDERNFPVGRIRDTIYFSILDSEWPEKKRALQHRLGCKQ